MPPPRISSLRIHNQYPPLPLNRHNAPHRLRPSILHPQNNLSLRLLSAPATPSLLKITTIPAPHCGHIRIISLNNPRTRNAISRQLLSELSAEIASVQKEVKAEEAGRKNGAAVGHGTRVLIIASEVDHVFCAGADLKERKSMTEDETRAFLHRLRHTFATLAGLPIPTLSAISSLALGGGLELALATTLRVFAPSAVVGLPETRLAIIPGAGGTYRLSALVGRARALDLILTGRRIVGTEAYRIGLCEWVAGVAEGMGEREKRLSVLGHAVERAREICEGGPGAVGAVVRAVRGGMEGEEREYEGLLGMADRMEALRAFQEKRGALFRGV